MTRALLSAIAVVLALGIALPNASAHAGDQSYLYLDFGETLTARLQMPFIDLAEHVGIEFGSSDDEIEAAIEANEAALREYAEAHFELRSGDAVLAREFVGVSRFDDTDYAEVAYVIETGASVPDQFEVSLDPFFDENGDRDALLLVANDWDRGVFDNEDEHLLRFTPNQRSQQLVLGESSSWNNFTTSIAAGLDHIRTGPDHMLFIFALVLPAVLVWTTEWKPVSGFGSSLWRVTKVLTMFTLAHSVTFSLAGIGLVPTPSARVTESIIALSIAATALHNLRPIFRQREWIIAFVFGLFHGFGFASLVQSLDVSTKTELISLAGRNIGIEIGQIFVVLLVFPSLYLLRVTRAYLPLLRLACIALIIASIGWMTERLFDAPAIVSKVTDTVLEFPRILVPLALVFIASAAWYLRERSADQLLDEEVLADTDERVLVGTAK